MAAEIDLVNRDRYNVNEHLNLQFEDFLAEPYEIYSRDCVWLNSFKCFICCQDLCYHTVTVFCGLCSAAQWGMQFAYISFMHVWCLTPCSRLLGMFCCGSLQKMYSMCSKCCLDPCKELCGIFAKSVQKSYSDCD